MCQGELGREGEGRGKIVGGSCSRLAARVFLRAHSREQGEEGESSPVVVGKWLRASDKHGDWYDAKVVAHESLPLE